MSANGISGLSTKEQKQLQKLLLAQTKRQGPGNGYRYLNHLDITTLPTVYSGNNVVDNPNIGGLVQGRPWTASTPTHTFSGTQASNNNGSNAVHIDTNPVNDAWCSTVPVGATIVADGIGTFTVAYVYAPGDLGNSSGNWFFTVTPNTSNFPAGTLMTFSW